MTSDRTYTKTHPWLTFGFDLNKLTDLNWMRIGEAISKCDHLSGVPLAPAVARDLHELLLTKGIHSTTQIEGNTLSEEQVREIVDGRGLGLPPSQTYLETEVTNVLDACNMVLDDLMAELDMTITRERILKFHELVLAGLPPKDDVVPGQTRKHSVVVGPYRGAPSEDIDYLLDRLCTWLADLCGPNVPQRYRRPMALIRAVLAHVYIAWIHPFGDGNGRTARLIEFQLLVSAGLPTPACHLLSNYYNKTKTRYYEVLSRTSRDPAYPVEQFVSYALDGLVEELREAVKVVRGHQMLVAWINYVHAQYRGTLGEPRRRQRDLVLSLPGDEFVPLSDVRHLNTVLAERYATLHPRTVARDVKAIDGSLIEVTPEGVRARVELMEAFLPIRAEALV